MTTPNEAVLPANHRLILDVVRESAGGTHLDALEIMSRARRRQPRLGLATVHRALGRLHELGLIAKVEVAGSASATYEPATRVHAHFVCSVCKTVSDIDYTVPKRTLNDISVRENIEISGESLTLHGRCARCRG